MNALTNMLEAAKDRAALMYISAGNRWRRFKSDLRNDERGVSPIVATVLLILIVVLLVGVFWGALSGWFTELWNSIVGNTPSQTMSVNGTTINNAKP